MAMDTVGAREAAMARPGSVSAAPEMGALSMGALARGSITVRFGDIVVDASGGDANEVAKTTTRAIRREIESFFAGLDNEG